MSLMRCPSCGTTYGGPTMAGFGCCPLCLAESQRVELLVYDDAESDTVPALTGLDATLVPGHARAHLN
jgi:hypothetical protein